jgi:hypothetical protein
VKSLLLCIESAAGRADLGRNAGLEALRRSDFELHGVHPFLRPFDTIPHRLLRHELLRDELGSLFMLSAIAGCVLLTVWTVSGILKRV